MAEYRSYMWSVPDWRTDEMYTMLDNREQGVYRNLIDECWVAGSITSDVDSLARFSREPLPYFLSVWAKIQTKFRQVQGGKRLISTRLEQDRRRLMLKGDLASKRAKKAAEIRWAKSRADNELDASSNAQAYAQAMLGDAQTQTQKEEGSLLQHVSNLKNSTDLKHRDRTRKTRAPDQLPITDAMRQWAADNGVTADLTAETAAMLDHHRGKGNLHSDWIATWRTWMRNSVRYGHRNGGSNGTKETHAERVTRKNRETAELFDRELHDATGDSPGTNGNGGTDRTLLPRPR